MTGSADLLVAGTLPPTVGGIAAAIDDQVRGLRARGWRVEVVNTGRSRRPRPGAFDARNALAAFGDAGRVGRAVRRTRPPVTAVHTTGSPLLPALRALAIVAAVRVGGSRAVVHVHGYDVEATVARGGGGYLRALRLLGRLAACVVVLHDDVATSVRQAAPGATVVVVPNCLDVAGVPATDGAGQSFRAVFVGTVGARKGVPELLSALAATSDGVGCDIVGGPGEEDEATFRRVQEQAAPLVAAGRVRFTGELDRAEAVRHLRSASAFVLPSHAEGMPVALLEAMAAAVPVVVTDVGAMGTLVREADAGIVVPAGDVTALTEALDRLASDPALRARMGANGRCFVERHHDCGRVLDDLGAIYRGAGAS